VSANFDSLPWYQKVLDYLWHITLPVLATVIGGFAALTMLTKTAFLMRSASSMSSPLAPKG
jgi:microcin C transport system permease protein